MGMNPLDFEELYDKIILAGVKSPGRVTITGHDVDIDWDVKIAPQQKGATTTIKGTKPCEFVCTFSLADREDFDAWPAFTALIRSSVQPPKPKALDIYHPDLVANYISSVVLKKMGGVVHDGKGGQTVAVTFLQYFPPKPVVATPLGSRTKDKDPDAEALKTLDDLTKEYEKTPWTKP